MSQSLHDPKIKTTSVLYKLNNTLIPLNPRPPSLIPYAHPFP